MASVGLDDYRHVAGTCHDTFVLPGREDPAPCGDPRCEAVAEGHQYRVSVTSGIRFVEVVLGAEDHEQAAQLGRRRFDHEHPGHIDHPALVEVHDHVTGALLMQRGDDVIRDEMGEMHWASDRRVADDEGLNQFEVARATDAIWRELGPRTSRTRSQDLAVAALKGLRPRGHLTKRGAEAIARVARGLPAR